MLMLHQDSTRGFPTGPRDVGPEASPGDRGHIMQKSTGRPCVLDFYPKMILEHCASDISNILVH